MNYYLKFKGKKYPISLPVFCVLLSISLLILTGSVYSIFMAFGWLGILLLILVTFSVTLSEKEYCLIANSKLKNFVVGTLFLSSLVVNLMMFL